MQRVPVRKLGPVPSETRRGVRRSGGRGGAVAALACAALAVSCVEAGPRLLTDARSAALRLERHYRRFSPARVARSSARARADVARLLGRRAPGVVDVRLRGEGPLAATADRAAHIDVNPDVLLRFPDGRRGVLLHLALVREHARIFQQRVLGWAGDDPRRAGHAARVLDRLARERGWTLERAALRTLPPPSPPDAAVADADDRVELALEDPATRTRALLALRARPDPRAAAVLRALLNDWDASVRAAAAACLLDLGRPPRDLVARLDEGIRARSRPALRASLAPALRAAARGRFRERCRLALRAACDDPDPAVRKAARAALRAFDTD